VGEVGGEGHAKAHPAGQGGRRDLVLLEVVSTSSITGSSTPAHRARGLPQQQEQLVADLAGEDGTSTRSASRWPSSR
jgi:hypothetical protein